MVEQIGGAGRAIAVRADVGDPAQVESMVGRIIAELGPISILVNNAGLAYRATLDTFDPTGMERIAPYQCGWINPFHPNRRPTDDRTSLRPDRQHNFNRWSRHDAPWSFAMELGRHGVTVNAVAPGFILTDMVKDGRTEQEYRDVVKTISNLSMLGRPGQPEDIAHAVAFLASPQAAFITAQILTVDGGRMDYIGHP